MGMESLRPSERSPLLDINNLNPEFISNLWSVCPGYLDTALSVFERHGQPFILVSTLAMIWSGSRNSPRKEIDVLVRSTHLQTLVDGLVETTDWEISENISKCTRNNTHIRDVWLKATFSDPQFEYIRLWPEELYHLSIHCHKIEVSDVYIRDTCSWKKSTTGTHVAALGHHSFDTSKKGICVSCYPSKHELKS
jgi:hypothetical protein